MIKRLLSFSIALLLAACAGLDHSAEYNPLPAAPAQAAPQTVSQPTPAISTLNAPSLPPAALPAGMTQPTKVALLLPLSGPHAEIGQALLQSAQLALFDLGAHGFQLLPRDTGDTPAGAEQAAEAAVHDGADIILGPVFAAGVRAAAPVAARAGVNMIAFSTDWTLAGGNTYILGFVPQGQVQRIVQYAAQSGIRRLAVLAPDGDYGDAVLSAYTKEAARDGVDTAATARLPAQGNIGGTIRTFAQTAASAQGVLIAAGGDQARHAAQMLTADGVGPAVHRLGTGLWDDPALAGEPALADAWFAAPSPDLRRDFERRYADTYGARPPRLATLAYDATALTAVLARKTGGGRASFTHASLTNPNGFAGVDGVFRFLPGGVAERGLAVLTFRNGAIGVQDAAPHTFQQATQ